MYQVVYVFPFVRRMGNKAASEYVLGTRRLMTGAIALALDNNVHEGVHYAMYKVKNLNTGEVQTWLVHNDQDDPKITSFMVTDSEEPEEDISDLVEDFHDRIPWREDDDAQEDSGCYACDGRGCIQCDPGTYIKGVVHR